MLTSDNEESHGIDEFDYDDLPLAVRERRRAPIRGKRNKKRREDKEQEQTVNEDNWIKENAEGDQDKSVYITPPLREDDDNGAKKKFSE